MQCDHPHSFVEDSPHSTHCPGLMTTHCSFRKSLSDPQVVWLSHTQAARAPAHPSLQRLVRKRPPWEHLHDSNRPVRGPGGHAPRHGPAHSHRTEPQGPPRGACTGLAWGWPLTEGRDEPRRVPPLGFLRPHPQGTLPLPERVWPVLKRTSWNPRLGKMGFFRADLEIKPSWWRGGESRNPHLTGPLGRGGGRRAP